MQSATMVLTQSDVEALLKNDSPESRVRVLEKVATNYNSSGLREREILIAEQIFRLLMKDAERFVRSVLADRLKANPGVPRDIVLHLANDHHEVSVPILKASGVLSDADLVQIIEATQEIFKLQAIAQRDSVSSRVSGALVETSYPQVIHALLNNNGAALDDDALEKLTYDFADEESVMLAVAARANLPAALIDKLMQHANANVTKALRAKYKFGAALVEKASHAVQENTLMQMLEREVTAVEMESLVHQMQRDERLNASIIMTALCRGHLHFVRVAIAKLADIPTINATKLLGDKGDLGVRAIYSRTQMPESMFAAVSLLLSVAHELEDSHIKPASQAYANAAVERLLTHPQAKEVDNLPYIIALLRGQPRR